MIDTSSTGTTWGRHGCDVSHLGDDARPGLYFVLSVSCVVSKCLLCRVYLWACLAGGSCSAESLAISISYC